MCRTIRVIKSADQNEPQMRHRFAQTKKRVGFSILSVSIGAPSVASPTFARASNAHYNSVYFLANPLALSTGYLT